MSLRSLISTLKKINDSCLLFHRVCPISVNSAKGIFHFPGMEPDCYHWLESSPVVISGPLNLERHQDRARTDIEKLSAEVLDDEDVAARLGL